MAAKTPTIEVFEGDATDAETRRIVQRHFYRVRGRNGEVLVSSEGFTRRGDATRAAGRLKSIVAAAELVRR